MERWEGTLSEAIATRRMDGWAETAAQALGLDHRCKVLEGVNPGIGRYYVVECGACDFHAVRQVLSVAEHVAAAHDRRYSMH